MRRIAALTGAAVAALFLALFATGPAGPGRASPVFDEALLARMLPGAWHVHSRVSDGAADRDTIAAAAARAGLRFVVFTDHGDGTREPEPPRYVHGVLLLDAVEISTNGGHYVALDMRRAPFPLGGEAAAVIEDVRRLGGFGVAAHPYSRKPALAWRDWEAPFDGLEWLNADSEWRDEPVLRLARLPFDYLLRPPQALASALDRPVVALERWDDLTARRPVVGLAAHDAHGGLGGREEGGWALPGIPSYEAGFRAFAIRAMIDAVPAGSAAQDARLVLDAIRRGRVFSVVDAIAGPAQLDFVAAAGVHQARMGDALPFESGVELIARATLPDRGSLVLVCDGREAGASDSGELRLRPDRPMACRPEVWAPAAPGSPPVPWLVGNAIYLLAAVVEPVGAEPMYETTLGLDHLHWTVEKDPASEGALLSEDGAFTLRYRLRDAVRASQYVAASASLAPPVPPFDHVLFTAEASGPMRVSLQLRFDGGERWGHSVYVEPDARRAIVPISSLVREGGGDAPRPDFRRASSILFVVDLVNAVPGASGLLRISDLSLARLAGS